MPNSDPFTLFLLPFTFRHMPSGNVIQAKGTVVEVLKHGAYRIQLSNGHRCIARASGELRLQFIRHTLGDHVHLEFNPYDLTRARIVVAS